MRIAARESVNHRQRAVLDVYDVATRGRDAAEAALRPWVLRHNKGAVWAGTSVVANGRTVASSAGLSRVGSHSAAADPPVLPWRPECR